MSMLGGLFGGGGQKHPNFDRLAHALQNNLGLATALPSADVMAVIDQMVGRELLHFDNARSTQGMQELFRARSIHATIDSSTLTVSLSLAASSDIETDLQTEHAQRKVLHFETRHSTSKIIRPQEPVAPLIGTATPKVQLAQTPVSLPSAFEHLEAYELLVPQIIDMFLRHGRLNSGDKDVLKKIHPSDGSLVSRITALERWQEEVTRRTRGLRVPKPEQRLVLGGASVAQAEKPEEVLERRFESLVQWMSKLIKTFEHTGGVKFHNKPMWLPH